MMVELMAGLWPGAWFTVTKDGKKVRISGERTINIRNDNLKKGFLEIDEILINKLKEFAK